MIYRLWYTANMPMHLITIKNAAADTQPQWSRGFLEDIAANGLRNPLVIDGHTSLRQFIPMVGNNRHWAARQLGWSAIRAVVSYPKGLDFRAVVPDAVEVPLWQLQSCFLDGVAYTNMMGWGVHSAPPPEKNY